MSAIIVSIILMLLGIGIFMYFMPVSLMLLALLVLIYFVGEKQKVMGILSCIFLIFTIYLWLVWDDINPYTEEKMAIREEQRMKEEAEEREKEVEGRRIQEEIDREKYIKKYGIEISKEDLESKLDSLIPQEYRGSHYEVNISCLYNSSDVNSFDISVQNEKFNDSKECRLFIGYIAKQLEQYYIWKPDFEFYTKDDGGIGKSAIIKNFRSIQNGTESVENVEFYEYEILTKQEEKELNEKNNDNNYIRNSGIDPLDRIKKLKELLDSGAITQEEYNKKKKALLE
ncbi:TPA: SHOCT domain-containing protein [Clostridioides difficile]|nr:SHOCT domain-containing protein [Clostridioides difficile]HBF4537337.1 SHOCT domain-containing protein [Clostridioides difficile]HBF4844465.1 SHOCT domain-containing protein [Clostridioides difficile]HBF5073443.1 SHOCT domain-containing protein [Clostridioides difficile]HBF5084956.1 SHOCT domain-containing protein [Clostridioides difficile]